MCPRSTTIAKRIEKARKTVLRFLFSQNIKAKRNGSPVCPEKKRSLPVKIPLKTTLLKKDDFMTMAVGKVLMCVRITKIDLIKVKRAILFINKGIQLGFLSAVKRITKTNSTDPYTKIPPTS